MKTRISILLAALASAATLPAAVTITVTNFAPNGIQSVGTGTGQGELSSTSGVITSDRGLPVTTYTVSGVDLTSVGGSSNETFEFTVTYTATGPTNTIGFAPFGNVKVGGNNFVDSNETLTATIALTSSSFLGLNSNGFTLARAGGFPSPTGETGTFTWTGGGSGVVSAGSSTAIAVSGDTITFQGNSTPVASSLNLEGFQAQFTAVPEPTSASLLAFGMIALLRRKRTV